MGIYRMRTELGHYFKWVLLIVLVPIFVIGGVNYFGANNRGGGPVQRQSGGTEVVAKVNGSEITRADYNAVADQAIQMAKDQGDRSYLDFADRRAYSFQQLVTSRLLVDAAKSMGVQISDRKANDEIDKIVSQQLKIERTQVLGKLSKEREATDPRDDSEFKNQLASVNRSIQTEEDAIRSKVPMQQVQAQLAQMGIMDKIKSEMKPVTDEDVKASYNIYKIHQILLFNRNQLPKEQFAARVAKVETAARSGSDFVKLASENSDIKSKNGGAADYSFDSGAMYPAEVRDAIQKLKPGEVSPAIQTQFGAFIIKLDAVEPKLPAKFDKKTMDARKKQMVEPARAGRSEQCDAEDRVEPECGSSRSGTSRLLERFNGSAGPDVREDGRLYQEHRNGDRRSHHCKKRTRERSDTLNKAGSASRSGR